MVYLIANKRDHKESINRLIQFEGNDILVFFNEALSLECYPLHLEKYLFTRCTEHRFPRIKQNLSSFREVFLIEKEKHPKVKIDFAAKAIPSPHYPIYLTGLVPSIGFIAVNFFLPTPLTLVDFTFQGWYGHAWDYERQFCQDYRIRAI